MSKFLKHIDPVFYVLRYFVLKRFFIKKLLPEEEFFVQKNINKHRLITWLTVVFVYVGYLGLVNVDIDSMFTVILVLLGFSTITGTAWFAISFGGISAKFLDIAMEITFWMFLSFTLSLSLMVIAISLVAPISLALIMGVAASALIISAIQYDTTDGLKSGLDEAVLKHSRAALIYYREKEGIELNENEN